MTPTEIASAIIGTVLVLWAFYSLGYSNGYSQAKWEEFNK